MKVFSCALCVLLTLALGSFAAAAEPKTINIGWTGGSGWTALPDQVATEPGFYVGTFRAKDKSAAVKPSMVRDWSLAEKAR